jgi:hydroxymethylpyrimidine pyrophosphatase-like HAD family hydrolase
VRGEELVANGPTHLLCFDLDGTLLDPVTGQHPPQVFHDYIDLLTSAGAACALVTGRSLPLALTALEQPALGLTPKFVVARDCEIHVMADDRQCEEFAAWNAAIQDAYRSTRRALAGPLAQLREYAGREPGCNVVATDASLLDFLCVDYASVVRLCRMIDRIRTDAPYIRYYCNNLHIRLGLDAFNKGTAVATIGQVLGIPARDIFAAGDNHNDLDMLSGRPAARVACPANAAPIVKAVVARNNGFVASQRAGTGVTEALHHMFFRG